MQSPEVMEKIAPSSIAQPLNDEHSLKGLTPTSPFPGTLPLRVPGALPVACAESHRPSPQVVECHKTMKGVQLALCGLLAWLLCLGTAEAVEGTGQRLLQRGPSGPPAPGGGRAQRGKGGKQARTLPNPTAEDLSGGFTPIRVLMGRDFNSTSVVMCKLLWEKHADVR